MLYADPRPIDRQPRAAMGVRPSAEGVYAGGGVGTMIGVGGGRVGRTNGARTTSCRTSVRSVSSRAESAMSHRNPAFWRGRPTASRAQRPTRMARRHPRQRAAFEPVGRGDGPSRQPVGCAGGLLRRRIAGVARGSIRMQTRRTPMWRPFPLWRYRHASLRAAHRGPTTTREGHGGCCQPNGELRRPIGIEMPGEAINSLGLRLLIAFLGVSISVKGASLKVENFRVPMQTPPAPLGTTGQQQCVHEVTAPK